MKVRFLETMIRVSATSQETVGAGGSGRIDGVTDSDPVPHSRGLSLPGNGEEEIGSQAGQEEARSARARI